MISLALLFAVIASDPLGVAREHLAHGRYEEALDAFADAERNGADQEAAALGVTRVYLETGQYDAAMARLDQVIAAVPSNADLLARRGEVRLRRGDIDGAQRDAEAALRLDADHLPARWVRVEVLTETGRIAEAADECRWFVRYYNRAQPTDAETLIYVAQASLRYARWKRVASIFHFTINELCPDITKADPLDWRAEALSGSLLLEKYNEAQGIPDLERALARNPHAADVHAVLAAAALEKYDLLNAAEKVERALAINPSLVPALGLKADLALIEGDLDTARTHLTAALAVNPQDQETLARCAAWEVIAGNVAWDTFSEAMTAIENDTLGESRAATVPFPLGQSAERRGDRRTADGQATRVPGEFERLVRALLQRNPRPGAFLWRLGLTLERRRLYREAERAYEAAQRIMPELSEPQVALALLSMRAGDLERAKEMLDVAFKSDPFHVRLSNMRKVVELLLDYETIETSHFVIRFDGTKDRVLAELAAESLEEAYSELTAEFGFEPPTKTVVELFHDGQGQSGHQWFSARMVGLPWLQTIGASTGLMVALASPTSGRQYNWARVLRHELVHVLTLQQTGFRIPHWYTEALAVRSEGYPRPQEWDDLLRERVPQGELQSLDELNVAFVRPASPQDWQFAYCQSLLYADYLDDQFGPEIHRKLLDGYGRGLSTEDVLTEATGLTADEFEAGYRDFLTSLTNSLGAKAKTTLSEEAAPRFREAAAAAQRGDRDRAIALLEEAFDSAAPQPQILELWGKLLLSKDATRAAELFALGREHDPTDRRWLRLHAAALVAARDAARLAPVLEEIAVTDADDSLAAKKLAELAAATGDAAATRRWALRALYVTPHDVALHRLLAEACDQLGDFARAATARRHIVLLERSVDDTSE
jgi:predicted Zn-dependent protease